MSKERLENMSPIGFDLNGNVLLKSEDYHWLMEQAERVEELEELLIQEKYDKNLFNARTEEWIKMKQQNQRYREALNFGIEYLKNSDIRQVQLVVTALKSALEGEK